MTSPIDRFDGEHSFLSNFYPAPIAHEGIIYPTVEHAFQAQKTHNPQERAKVANAKTPASAKQLGKRVKLRPDWEGVKVELMLELVRAKFRQHPDLAARLLETGDAQLIEGNQWRDTFWGVYRGKGRNELGKALMLVRDELKG